MPQFRSLSTTVVCHQFSLNCLDWCNHNKIYFYLVLRNVMADLLLNKAINEEIASELLIKWILNEEIHNNEEDFKGILDCSVGQIDFITYFLNFLHEEVPCINKVSETPQKSNTPKQTDEGEICDAKEKCKAFIPSLSKTQSPEAQNHIFSPNTSVNIPMDENSTPKAAKFSGHKTDSYFSPISPLYENPIQTNFNVKQSKQDNENKKSADRYSLCLGDFLVTNSKSISKKKKSKEHDDSKKEASRRIKPTSICPKQLNTEFQKTENSFNFQDNVDEVSVKTAVEQRNVLAEERIKILSRKNKAENSTFPVLLKRQNSLSKSDTIPTLKMVTFKNNINHLVDIYKTILDHQLMLNITSEIYFLISLFLMTPRQQSATDNTYLNMGVDFLDSTSNQLQKNEKSAKLNLHNLEIFESIHNIVYFSVKCIESQMKVIQLYDKTTLRLLAENERLVEFLPGFSKKLLAYAEKKSDKLCIEIDTPVSQTNVSFNVDTETKDSFVDILEFQNFRKQRDLFCDILRIWENHHLATNWNFSIGLGGKIRSLFSFYPTNYMNLARLFKNQLLRSCAKGSKETGLSENRLSFLPQLPIDQEKLNRLTDRLVTKQTSNGINSLPVFAGYQEFFKDFLLVASNYFFNRHLCDILVAEIVELNDTKFSGMELDEEGNEVDQNIRKRYVSCIKDLRILAKFLGFVETLPYRSDITNLSKHVLDSQLKIREQHIPSLNVKALLQGAIEKHTLVLIIPWLTKYLAMLDYVTLRLPYYTSMYVILFDLHQNYKVFGLHDDNAAVIKFCLGWLFELPHFPDVDYFNFCSKLIHKSRPPVKSPALKAHRNGINGTKVHSKSRYLDSLGIVSQSVVYLCCPYLEEIKKILSTNAAGSKISVKYITPVTTLESNTEMSRKKLEHQLEEAFFSAQPTSLRRTVEFVSERIASTAVKFICHDLVTKAKEAAIKDLKEKVLKNDDAGGYADHNQRKILLKKEGAPLAQTHLTLLLQTCEEEIQRISQEKIPPAIEHLLPIDALDGIKNTCIGITKKMYEERVKQWINNHVSLVVFTKEFDSAIQKKVENRKRNDKEKAVFGLPGGGRNCDHNENSLSGFHALNNIREACCKATESNGITQDYVVDVLQETYKSLTQRNDINEMITAVISSTIFNFCLLLIAGHPSIFSNSKCNLTSHFLKIWSHQPKSNSMFKALFCPRNVTILQYSHARSESWDLYARIVSSIFEQKLIEEEELESQCTGFYNRDWDTMTHFTSSIAPSLRNIPVREGWTYHVREC